MTMLHPRIYKHLHISKQYEWGHINTNLHVSYNLLKTCGSAKKLKTVCKAPVLPSSGTVRWYNTCVIGSQYIQKFYWKNEENKALTIMINCRNNVEGRPSKQWVVKLGGGFSIRDNKHELLSDSSFRNISCFKFFDIL